MTKLAATKIHTCLWFKSGGEEAAKLYVSLFPDSELRQVTRWPEGSPLAGQPLVVDFVLAGHHVSILNGGPEYKLSPAVSLSVACDSQQEIDRLWSALLANGGVADRCGWLTDRFGVSWQIVPSVLPEMLSRGGAKAAAVTAAFMKMVKFDLAALQQAFDRA